MLSIIVALYNTEKYLSCCIESLCSQTLEDLEIILVDDGSTDQSGYICDTYAQIDSRIIVIHQDNAGAFAARLNGLSLASGEYISFVDSDDWVERNLFRNMMDVMEKHAELDVCIIGSKQMKETGEVGLSYPLHSNTFLTREEAVHELIQHHFFGWELWGKVYKKYLLKNLPYSSNIVIAEDLFLNWHVFKQVNKVFFQASYGYYYRVRPGSLMREKSWQTNTWLEVLEQILADSFAKRIGVWDELARYYVISLLERILNLIFDGSKHALDKVPHYQKKVKETVKEMPVREIEQVSCNKLLKVMFDEENCCNGLIQRTRWLMKNLVIEAQSEYPILYLYGAGVVARYFIFVMREFGGGCKACVVSDGESKKEKFMGYNVKYLSDIPVDNIKQGFILGMDAKHQETVKKILNKKGHKNVFFVELPEIFL